MSVEIARAAHFHHNAGTCPCATLCHPASACNIVWAAFFLKNPDFTQITHNLSDKGWYRRRGKTAAGKTEIWSFLTSNFEGLTRTHTMALGEEESSKQALSHKRSQSKRNSEKSREEKLEAIKQTWLTLCNHNSCSLHIAAGYPSLNQP